jgi:hypothetical protein
MYVYTYVCMYVRNILNLSHAQLCNSSPLRMEGDGGRSGKKTERFWERGTDRVPPDCEHQTRPKGVGM